MPHDTIDRPHSGATERTALQRHSDQGATPQSLIDELEDAIANKDLHHRAAVLRRITDLFVANGSGFSAEQIAMFDDVMSRLVVAIDSLARAEFGAVLAKHPNAPPHTSRILALDDAIEVAGPMLSQSNNLDDATLVEGAKTKSQEHLYAISLRGSIGEAVTDVLVERGDTEVVKSTAANPGAKFSEFGCATLATRSRDDSELALQVWSRDDIPRQHLLSLFAIASEAVQKQLAAADRKKVELYRYIIAQANSQIQTKMRESSTHYAAARPYVEVAVSVRHIDRRARGRVRAGRQIRSSSDCFVAAMRFASRTHRTCDRTPSSGSPCGTGEGHRPVLGNHQGNPADATTGQPWGGNGTRGGARELHEAAAQDRRLSHAVLSLTRALRSPA